MCGRYVLGDASWAAYHSALRIIRPEGEPDGPSVSFNICPTQMVNVAIPTRSGLIATAARWGLIPSWFRKPISEWKATTFNARIEEAHQKPSFKGSWKYHRCIVPASGYYEWTGQRGSKTPHYISLRDNKPVFFFAGLYSDWEDINTVTVLTRAALPEIADIHHRMPVILTDHEIERWLYEEVPGDEIRASFGLGVEGMFQHHQVQKFSNRDNGPALIEPAGLL